MERTERRRLYRTPLTIVAIGSACSAIARAIGVLWLAVPLLVVAAICLIVGTVKLVQAAGTLPAAERRKERRQMVVGAVGTLVAVAVVSGLILVLFY
jgi:uncharacterized membrane protein YjjP (DUF1212 family)